MSKLPSVRDYSKEKIQILRLLSLGSSVAQACEEVGIARRTLYDLRDREPAFREEWDYAVTCWRENLLGQAEAVLRDRAFDINDKAGHTLLMFMLRRLEPEYRDNYKTEKTIRHESVQVFEFSDEELDLGKQILENAKRDSSTAPRSGDSDS